MDLRYPDLLPGTPLCLRNAGYFTDYPKYIGQIAHFIRYATPDELERGAGPYLIQLPHGNAFAALDEEFEPLPRECEGVVFHEADW